MKLKTITAALQHPSYREYASRYPSTMSVPDVALCSHLTALEAITHDDADVQFLAQLWLICEQKWEPSNVRNLRDFVESALKQPLTVVRYFEPHSRTNAGDSHDAGTRAITVHFNGSDTLHVQFVSPTSVKAMLNGTIPDPRTWNGRETNLLLAKLCCNLGNFDPLGHANWQDYGPHYTETTQVTELPGWSGDHADVATETLLDYETRFLELMAKNETTGEAAA